MPFPSNSNLPNRDINHCKICSIPVCLFSFFFVAIKVYRVFFFRASSNAWAFTDVSSTVIHIHMIIPSTTKYWIAVRLKSMSGKSSKQITILKMIFAFFDSRLWNFRFLTNIMFANPKSTNQPTNQQRSKKKDEHIAQPLCFHTPTTWAEKQRK